MKITQFTDYSLRLLLHLGRNRDRVVTVREVAEHYDISAEHLKKIVRRLSDLGHIQTVRGKKGGLLLARDPAGINLGQLFRAEENLQIVPCAAPGAAQCCPVADCKLAGVLQGALGSFLGVLDANSLADIL